MLEDVGEISDILGRSYGMPDEIDEADLDAELDCLEDEWAEELDAGAAEEAISAQPSSQPSYLAEDQLPAQPTGPAVPAAPTTVFSHAQAAAVPGSQAESQLV